MTKYNVPMLAASGYVAQIDSELCLGCGDCEAACPFDAITMINDLASVVWENCMGCSVCVGQCAVDAATLVLDERKGIPMDVRTIGV
jgi:Na+-translocating ferredoxin:NAD+ oxidoreductase RNF subunit RnfB